MHKKIVFSLLCSTFFISPAFAGMKEAMEFFEQKKYNQAFEEFSYLSDEGDNIASFHMGLLYENGWGVKQSFAKAAEYYNQSYSTGNPMAASKLGTLFVTGQGIEKNIEKGFELLKTAARAGNPDAQYNLGEIYAKGESVTKDYVYAGGFYKMSALQGYAPAQYKLGLLYLYGRGVPQDYSLAVKWLSRSANQGYVKAQHDLAELHATNKNLYNPVQAYTWFNIIAAYNTDEVGTWAATQRDAIALKIKEAKNLKFAQEAAINWRPKAPKETVPERELIESNLIIPGYNDVDTLRQIKEKNDLLLSDGTAYGIRTDELEKALLSGETIAIENKIEKRGKTGAPDAYTYWGRVIETRLQNPKKSVDWYVKAAELGDAEAQYRLSQFYCEGVVVAQDPVVCYMWLQLSLETAKSPLKDFILQTKAIVDPQLSDSEKMEGKKKADDWKAAKTKEETTFKLF